MKVHRIVLSVIDFDNLGAEEVCSVLAGTHYPNDCISPKVIEIKTADCGEWGDEHPLNNRQTFAAELNRLFSGQSNLADLQ